MTQNHYRVLVVDDDSNTRALLKLLFESRGYEVALAPDGEGAIALAQQQRPDIILLDAALPRRSGLEVYHDLQALPAVGDVPVIVFSAALTQRELTRWREQAGCVAAITKPFDIHSLLSQVGQVLDGQPATRPAASRAAA